MSIQKYTSAILINFLLFSSCKKEELPIPPHNPGNVTTVTVNMEANYKWQLFYNLETNTVISKNLKTSWDLGFEASTEGYRIILNASKVMLAWNIGTTSFSEITDTIGFAAHKRWDEPSGNLDSTAIGDWRNTNTTYIIDRGYSETGVHQGFRKMQFMKVDANAYTVRFANLNGANETMFRIIKDKQYNFMFLSFATNQLTTVEPPKDKWDLEFTQYTHVFKNPEMTYLVTGCLLNRYQTVATKDATIEFAAIAYGTISTYNLCSAINVIGYDWKTYKGSTYVTNPDLNYIIRNNKGLYYKLHFIDFFNSSGTKGNPKWEYQQL